MAASPTASASGSVAAAAAAASEANDGPVLSVVSKRLRALRKKQNRIAQMEESVAAGKTLNQEQKEVLRSKPVVAALIDEFERLRSPLSAALTEELATVPAPSAAPAPAAGSDSSIQDLLALVYFGSLFDVKPQSEFIATMVAREQERSSCLTYDTVGDDTVDILVENDLNIVSDLAALAAARPASSVGVTHRDALQACAHHARLWLARAEEPIHPGSPVTYAAVRTKLDRIMASGYYTAAAVDGNYGAEGVQTQESMSASPEAPSVEENLAAEGHKDENEDTHATETYNAQSNAADVQDVDGDAPANPPEEYAAAESEQEKFDVEGHDQRDAEPEEQQFQQPRRSHQNQRGGRGRRGYPNGSRGGRGGRGVGGGYQNGRGGGGGYQNGRGGGGGYQGGGGYHGGGGYQGGGGGYQNGQGGGGGGYYNDDGGYYQQRNYRGRGGRSGGGNYYNNQGGGQQGGGAYTERVELGANA